MKERQNKPNRYKIFNYTFYDTMTLAQQNIRVAKHSSLNKKLENLKYVVELYFPNI